VGSAQITDGQVADADVSGTAAIATSKLSGAVTSIAGHGLGSLATLSAVGSAQITDGTIANADISGTAAIATSKLSGAVTSISGHGLGALATASAVGSAEITDGAVSSTDIADGTIANADISASAAIATSKLSGALTSVAGHGLGSLASLSAVGSAQITDGTIASADIADATIANADISSSAAIATSKLSGAVTSISGHGLGTAATLDVGTGANNVVQLTVAGKLPAVDGSLVTGIVASDSTKVLKSGDTMTGTLNLPANGLVAGTSQLVLSGGNVGIGTSSPGSPLDVKGTLRLSGSSSGYVGLAPASAAGSTTYTLPSAAPSTNEQVLGSTTGGSMSWKTLSISCTQATCSAADPGSCIVSCPATYQVTGGGCYRPNGNYACLTRPSGNGWECNNISTGTLATCYAHCCKIQ
jgi:hypothetical protein